MKITRIYSTVDGASHIEDLDIPLHEAGEIGLLSQEILVEGLIFRENAPDYDYNWHNAPRRQYIVLLDGNI